MGRRDRTGFQPLPIRRPADWEETVEQFCGHLRDLEKSPATIKGYRGDLRGFARWYRIANDGDLPELLTIDAVDLRDWKTWMQSERKMLPQSINRPLAAIQSLLEWGQAHEWCQAVQMPRTVAQATQPPRWLTKTEQHAVERAVTAGKIPRDIALVKLLLYAGLRIAEAASLLWINVDARERTGSVTVVGKGRKRRTIPLHKEARRALMALSDDEGGRIGMDAYVFAGRNGPNATKTLWQIVTRYGTKNLDLSPHILRHTFCHNLAIEGARLESIAALAGHESIETTRRYVEPGQDDLRSYVERLGGGEPEQPPPARKRAPHVR